MDIQNSKTNSVLFIEDLLFYQDVFLLENSNNKPKEFTLNRFVKIEDNQPKYVYDWKDQEGKDAISVGNLYELYINWVQNNHEKSVNKNIFGSNINHLVKNSGNTKIDKVQKRWVQF